MYDSDWAHARNCGRSLSIFLYTTENLSWVVASPNEGIRWNPTFHILTVSSEPFRRVTSP